MNIFEMFLRKDLEKTVWVIEFSLESYARIKVNKFSLTSYNFNIIDVFDLPAGNSL